MKKVLFALALLSALMLLFVGCSETTTTPDQTSTDKAMPGTAIPGHYVVILKDGVSDKSLDYAGSQGVMRGMAQDVLTANGVGNAAVPHVYSKALSGFSAHLSPVQAAQLATDERVARIEPDQYVSICRGGPPSGGGPVAETMPWGITRVGGAVNYSGNNVAWIIDSGIDLDHPDLNVDASRGYNFIDPAVSPDDDNGHGTHVAGTVAAIDNDIDVVGVAAGATVIPVKVLDRRGSGSMTGVLAGVDFVAANGSAGDVANMSLGGPIYELLDEAVVNASNGGIHFALAAGNESTDANSSSPARANGTYIYTVSAGDINDNWASFSNYGNPPVDYNAPGYNILSLAPGGGVATMSGTSMASPHVCGLLLSTGGSLSMDGTINGDPDGNPDPIAHR